jgi:hypothetical protein
MTTVRVNSIDVDLPSLGRKRLPFRCHGRGFQIDDPNWEERDR